MAARNPSVKQPLLGVGALIVTVCLWGLSAVAIKSVSTNGVVTAMYRLWFAIQFLWLSMLAPSLRSRLDRRWLRASIIGGTIFGIHQIFFFTSLNLTSVANVTIIGALQLISFGVIGTQFVNMRKDIVKIQARLRELLKSD